MRNKQALECEILRSFVEYPNKMSEFLYFTPLKCFSNEAQELLGVMETLRLKNLLNITSLNASLSDEFTKKAFYINFLASPSNVMVLDLAQTLKKLWQIEQQKEIAEKLKTASSAGELLDLEFLSTQSRVENKNFKTLTQWENEYLSKGAIPKLRTGIEFLDSLFNENSNNAKQGGIELGQLVLISGDPEAGKTSLGMQILENMAFYRKVAFFCFEFTLQKYIQTTREREKNTPIKVKFDNIFALNEGYHIYELADNIKSLYKLHGIQIFFIDSQMRVTNTDGRNQEEEESQKFSLLARLCHSLNIIVILVVQNAKNDKENPMGTKKGGHEASIIIRVERDRAKGDEQFAENGRQREYSENTRTIILQKNKQTGKHYKEQVFFSTLERRFYKLESDFTQAKPTSIEKFSEQKIEKELPKLPKERIY